MSYYTQSEYWNKRYEKCFSSFEWHSNYEELNDLLLQLIQKEHSILYLGCGNSELTSKLFEDGYEKITNIDFSGIVIKQMKEKYEDKGEFFQFLEMDARKMQFEDCMFDCIIDKGTIDTLLLNQNGIDNVIQILTEVSRVLNYNGQFLFISYAFPEEREALLTKAQFNWEIKYEEIKCKEQTEFNNKKFLYICTKKSSNDKE